MKPYRDLAVESQIKQYTDVFNLAEINLSDIDVKRSLQSQNRAAVKLDEENVLRISYAEDQAGIVVPPIIVNSVRGKYLVVDGNHRSEARRVNGKATISAYVVEVDSDTYEKMCIQGNAFNGRPLSDDERFRHAMALVDMGEPASIVAPRWGMTAERLTARRRADAGRVKANQAGVIVSEKRPLSDKKAEIVNRLEEEHIRILGKEILDATVPELESAQKAIADAPSSQRRDEALKQAGRLEENRQKRNMPKSRNAKRAMSQATAKRLLRELISGVKANPSILNDVDFHTQLAILLEVTGNAVGAEQAA